MGACLNIMEVDGKASQQEVADQFGTRCNQDSWESGNSYSGSFSQFTGLSFTGREFETELEANDYIDVYGEKWGPAVVVRYKVIVPSKRMIAFGMQALVLREKVTDAENKLYKAKEKMRINNRTTEPAYVKSARTKLEQVMVTVNPKIEAKLAKRAEIEKSLAAKSKKSKWLIGGWCSS